MIPSPHAESKIDRASAPLPVTDLASAVRRLAIKKVVIEPRDCISERVLGGATCLYAGYSRAQRSDAVASSPASDEETSSRCHEMIYQARPDVGAVVEASSQWVARLAVLGTDMAVVFDEQARQLGTSVPFLPSLEKLDPGRLRELLAKGDNACVMEGRMLCLGYSLERAVFNAELFEKCAMSFVLARLTGRRVGKIPWLIQSIASKRLRRDELKAAEAYALGQKPTGLGGYA